MLRDVSARYWSLEPTYPGTTFAEILKIIFDVGDPGAREIEIESDYSVRLERLEKVDRFLIGEVCRVQRENIPPAAGRDGMSPMHLADGEGIGHRSTFIADEEGASVLWHQDQMACTPVKFAVYLSHFGTPSYKTKATPYAVSDVWTELKSAKEVRAFSVKVQPEENLSLFDDGQSPLMDLARASVSAYHGHTIEISIVAAAKSKLDKGNVTRTIMQVLGFSGTRKAKAIVASADGPFLLDFLNRHRTETGKIERFSDDIEDDYRSRKNFLLTSYHAIRNHVDGDPETDEKI